MFPSALTVAEFRAAYRLGRSQLYKLWSEGRGPPCYHVGRRRFISAHAAAEWQRGLEVAAATALLPDEADELPAEAPSRSSRPISPQAPQRRASGQPAARRRAGRAAPRPSPSF